MWRVLIGNGGGAMYVLIAVNCAGQKVMVLF